MLKRILPFLALAAACQSSKTPAFALSVSPASLTLPPLATATAVVTAEGVAGAVTLAVETLPDGVTVDAPPIAAGSTTAVLTFHNRRTGSPVTGVKVAVRASAGETSASTSLSLTVQCPGTAAPSMRVLAGAPGGGGDADDIGQDARFNGPFYLAGDGGGSLYVADSFNSVIRRLDLFSGAVTTFAGSPRQFDYKDGVGLEARFSSPFGIARDGSDLYVADSFSQVIRKVDLRSGAVTTVAGRAGEQGAADGPAADARFSFPIGLAAADGSLFVADQVNQTIRRIDLATGFVSTLAGSAGMPGAVDGTCDEARFSGPTGLAADAAGHLFVADHDNHTIRMIDIASASVTTLAGTAFNPGNADGRGAAARFSGPTGVATDGAGGVFVADAGNHLIRRIAVRTGDVATVAGVTSGSCNGDDPARLCFPSGVAVDQGTVYVADTAADRVVMLAGGEIVALAGQASHRGSADGPGANARFNGPISIATDGADSVYVPEFFNGTVRRVTVSSAEVSTVAEVGNPEAVAVVGEALYLTDSGTATVDKVDLASGEVTVVAGAAGESGSDDGVGAAARFFGPTGLVSDGNRHLYVGDFGSIRKIDLDTSMVTTLQLTSSDGGRLFGGRVGLALDGAGNLYVADPALCVIRRVDLASQVVTTLAGSRGACGFAEGPGADARFASPLGLGLDGAGGLLVADSGNSVVRRIELATGIVSTFAGLPGAAGVKPGPLPGRLNFPAGIALSGSGRLIVADFAEEVLLAFDP